MKRRRTGSAFVFLPRDLLLHPPLDELSPLELAVACGLITSARLSEGDSDHSAALAAGASNIEKEKELGEQLKREWETVKLLRKRGLATPAPRRHHTFITSEAPYKTRYAPRKLYQQAGKYGYRSKKAALRKLPPAKIVTLSISRSGLLKAARVSADGANLKQLDAVLHRLCQSVQINDEDWGPVLLSFEELPSGKLLLEVSGDWLHPPFGRLPLPLPTRSPVALALYLFLTAINTSPLNKSSISFETLCKRLGIPVRQEERWRCQQALDRALDIINAHLLKLEAAKIRAPAAYKIVAENEQIRFEKLARPAGHQFSSAVNEVRQKVRTSRPKLRVKPVRERLPPEALKSLRLIIEQHSIDKLARDRLILDETNRLAEHRRRLDLFEQAEAGNKAAALALGFRDDD